MDTTLAVQGLSVGTQMVIAGLVATAVMTLFVFAFNRLHLLQMNPVAAIGSTISENQQTALVAGSFMHITLGIAFAFIYAGILRTIGLTGPLSSIFGAAGIGAAHGYVVSFLVVIFIGEHNRFAEFRREGVGLAVIYLVAHLLYGATLGAMFSLFRTLQF